MGAIASQITSLTIVYWIVCSDADQRKHQSSPSLAFVRGSHRGSVNSPHKWPVTRKMFPFDDVIIFASMTKYQISFITGLTCLTLPCDLSVQKKYLNSDLNLDSNWLYAPYGTLNYCAVFERDANLDTVMPENGPSRNCSDRKFRHHQSSVSGFIGFFIHWMMTSFKMADETSRNLAALRVLSIAADMLYWLSCLFMMTSSNENIFRVTGPFVRGIHRSPVNSPHKGQ